MRICYIGDPESPHISRRARWFSKKGHDIHVIYFNTRAKIRGVAIHSINIKDSPFFISYPVRISSCLSPMSSTLGLSLFIPKIRKIVTKIKPEILHGCVLTDCAFYAACTGFKPLVVEPWGSDVLIRSENIVLRSIEKYALSKVDAVFVNSEFMKNTIITKLGYRGKMQLISLGVNVRLFFGSKPHYKLRHLLNLGDAPVVVSVRNLRPVYDIQTLIEAIPEVLREIPNTRFVIGGDGELRSYLENLTRKIGVEKSVRFVGMIPHEMMPEYFRIANVYVSTSLSDGCSVSLLEAMACELAPVVTDVKANREWIADGINGYIVPKKDSKHLAEKIVYLLRNKNIRTIFGQRNRQIIIDRAEEDKSMRKMEAIYESLLAKR